MYKTRVAIGRAVQALGMHAPGLQLPFLWYGRLFLRVSHAVSRRQEFIADRLAAQTVGAHALIEGLKKVHGAAAAYPHYLSSEVIPLLEARFLPPVAEGFARFVAADAIARQVATVVESAINESAADPYDTHPSLRERTTALEDPPTGHAPEDNASAVTLLSGLEQLERSLVTHTSVGAEAALLTRVGWEEVGARVYGPMWADVARRHAQSVRLAAVHDLRAQAPELADVLGGAIAEGDQVAVPPELRRRHGAWVLGAIFASALVERGWTIRTGVGEPLMLDGPSGAIEPFQLVQSLVSGDIDGDAWADLCARLRLDAVELPGEGSGMPRAAAVASGEPA